MRGLTSGGLQSYRRPWEGGEGFPRQVTSPWSLENKEAFPWTVREGISGRGKGTGTHLQGCGGQEGANGARAETLAGVEHAGPRGSDMAWAHGKPLGLKGRGLSGVSDFPVGCPGNRPRPWRNRGRENLVGGVRLWQV